MPDEVLTPGQPQDDQRPVAGFFGKLPATGDFVWRGLPDGFRKYYGDATRVPGHASHVDEKTARRALQFTTQVLRNLFEIPAELAPHSEPEDEPE